LAPAYAALVERTDLIDRAGEQAAAQRQSKYLVVNAGAIFGAAVQTRPAASGRRVQGGVCR
jgi:hypothetical protein